MAEKISPQPKPDDIFGGQTPNFTGIDPFLNGVEAAAQKTGKFAHDNRRAIGGAALATTAVVLGGCSPHESGPINIDPSTIAGCVGAVVGILEEGIEKEKERKAWRKLASMGIKGLAGYTLCYSATHIQRDQPWDSQENISTGLEMLGSLILIGKETSLEDLARGLAGKAQKAVASAGQERDFNAAHWSLQVDIKHAARHKSSKAGVHDDAIESLKRLQTLLPKAKFFVKEHGQTYVNDAQIDELMKIMGEDGQLSREEFSDIINRYV